MAATSSSSVGAHPRQLCLKCRRSGHRVDQCLENQWEWESSWFFSDTRRHLSFETSLLPDLCMRCQDLNVVQLLRVDIPWKTVQDFENAFQAKDPLIKNLGKTGVIEFDYACSLCRCLFALTPNPASEDQDVLLFPNYTIYRVTGEKGAIMDTTERRQYAKCLLVALEPSPTNLGVFIRAHRGDALCAAQDSSTDLSLGGRLIKRDTTGIEVMNEWLSQCSSRHGPECLPFFTEELRGIRLIDVKARITIIHPDKQVRYAALSYVWGPVEQPSFPLGAKIGDIPRTIEVAITCAKSLGLQYLWVDSICIEQSNETHKLDQINRMYSIYRGAWITFIALSGPSVNAGFPRMSSDSRPYSQLQCDIDGTSLVGLMPTLTNQIWVAAWGTRAWTLQEGILSPRCLYLSDHGLYFECAAMQCCEALDQKISRAHNLSPSANPTTQPFTSWAFEEAGPGCLRNPLDSPASRLEHWGAKLTLYSYRSMSKEEDALNAFTGIEQRLGEIYTKGFFWGLPLEDFQWGLLWWAPRNPIRRPNFPSWSWLGWKVAVWHGAPQDVTKPRQFLLDVRISRIASRSPVPFFQTTYQPMGPLSTEDPLQQLKSFNTMASLPASAASSEIDEQKSIFIEAVSFEMAPDFSRPWRTPPRAGEHMGYDMAIGGVRCILYLMGVDVEIPRMSIHEETKYLLLARDRIGTWACHYLLAVYVRGPVAMRGTVLMLFVPENRLDVLRHLKPKLSGVVLL